MDDQHKYWHGRWERKETGWHQAEVEQELIESFKNLAPTRVLVPLCGKSRDLMWLASQNHTVIGVELYENACKEFFEENKLTPSITTDNSFKIFTAKNITLYCGDFFKLSPAHLGAIGAVYDRAALIALPPDLRAQYASHMISLLKECAPSDLHFLQISWQREPHDLGGPPFSVKQDSIEAYYGKTFNIRFIRKEKIDFGSAESKSFQYIYELSWR